MVIKTSAKCKDINKYLKEDRIITFTKGTYKITETLYFHSDTIIDLNGSSLRRYCSKPIMMSYATENTVGYDGVKNVIIKNGTIEGMNGLGFNSSNLCALFHANNIIFENITFLDSVGSHCLDIVGCSNVTVNNCKFLGYCSFGHDFRESIQIDFAYAGGLPYYNAKAKTYDMTKCKNITVSNCEFGSSKSYPSQYCAIGTHEQANNNTWHENISIIHNKAHGNGLINGNGFFFRIMNFKDVIVKDNTVDNYGRFVVCTMPKVLRNSDSSTVEPKNVLTTQNVIITDNKVLSNGYKYVAYAVYIEDTYGNAKNIIAENFNSDLPKNAVCIKLKG